LNSVEASKEAPEWIIFCTIETAFWKYSTYSTRDGAPFLFCFKCLLRRLSNVNYAYEGCANSVTAATRPSSVRESLEPDRAELLF